jgi:hypothetical protein
VKEEFNDRYTYSSYDVSELGVPLVGVRDNHYGISIKTALSSAKVPAPSLLAFAGARFSRSDKGVEEILKEIKESQNDAGSKLAAIFHGYGHASVADMAQVFIYIENVPLSHAFRFFYETALGGGQERSTRYQDFGNVTPLALLGEEVTLQYQRVSLNLYRKWVSRLEEKFTTAFKLDLSERGVKSALKARVFDCARYFLLQGLYARTSLAWVTSAREWARLIGVFKTFRCQYWESIVSLLERLLNPDMAIARKLDYVPEVAELLRYTDEDGTTAFALKIIKSLIEEGDSLSPITRNFIPDTVQLVGSNLSAGEKLFIQLLLECQPNLNFASALQLLKTIPTSKLEELSQRVFRDFTHHRQMGAPFRSGTLTLACNLAIGEARDFNRHRAFGRYTPLFSENWQYERAYTLPLYFLQGEVLQDERSYFEEDLDLLYTELEKILRSVPESLRVQLLPLGSSIQYYLHGGVKEVSYLSKLRVRPGGHINYRWLSYMIAKEVAESEPLLFGLNLEEEKPEVSSRDEFLSRA